MSPKRSISYSFPWKGNLSTALSNFFILIKGSMERSCANFLWLALKDLPKQISTIYFNKNLKKPKSSDKSPANLNNKTAVLLWSKPLKITLKTHKTTNRKQTISSITCLSASNLPHTTLPKSNKFLKLNHKASNKSALKVILSATLNNLNINGKWKPKMRHL